MSDPGTGHLTFFDLFPLDDSGRLRGLPAELVSTQAYKIVLNWDLPAPLALRGLADRMLEAGANGELGGFTVSAFDRHQVGSILQMLRDVATAHPRDVPQRIDGVRVDLTSSEALKKLKRFANFVARARMGRPPGRGDGPGVKRPSKGRRPRAKWLMDVYDVAERRVSPAAAEARGLFGKLRKRGYQVTTLTAIVICRHIKRKFSNR
jgi:N-acetyl-anhydromuramyl-L-alanine amidase AmpD